MADELEPDDEEAGGQVIALRTGYDPEADEAPVQKKPRTFPTSAPCRHRHAILDPEKRTLVCRHCDEVIDPFDFVDRLAADWTWYERRVKDAKLRARNAEELTDRRVKELERVRARASRGLPMAVGKRLGQISRHVGNATVELAEALACLAKAQDLENPTLFDHYLGAAERRIALARAGYTKLVRDHGRRPVDAA